MRFPRWQIIWVWLFALLAVPALGQEKLPIDIITSTSALTTDQIQVLENYIATPLDNLKNGTDDQIIAARQVIVVPFENVRASVIFKAAYSNALIQNFIALAQSPNLLIRINIMVAAEYLNDAGAAKLIQAGIIDENSSVRYLASKAAAAAGNKLEKQAQENLLTVLVKAFSKETDQIVVEQLLAGIGSLTIVKARKQLLNGLNRRVRVHARNHNLSIEAERTSFSRLFSRVVREVNDDKPVTRDFLKQMGLVALRNMLLGATLLDEGVLRRSLTSQWVKMIEISNTVLQWVSAKGLKIDKRDLPKDDIKTNLDARRWTEVRIRSEEWKRLLQDPPYEYPASQLNVHFIR